MKLKILNLNIFNYVDFEKRKPRIIQFIRKHNPDIITFQEIRDDVVFNKKGDNQAKQLNRELHYPYYAFCSVTDKRKERPERYKRYCIEGSALLSKFPIIKAEKKQLKQQKEDIHAHGILYARIKAEKIVDIAVIHFSNNNLFSLLHLIETMKYLKKRKLKPIMAGDFNMYHSDWLDELTEEDYKSSMNFRKYISYPHNKYTLDYILIPKKFRFKSFRCEGKGLSDHKALIAEIEIK